MKTFGIAIACGALTACSPASSPDASASADAGLVKARAMQAMVCVKLERVPVEWRQSKWLPSGPGIGEVWQTISDEPLVDHGFKSSAVLERFSDRLFLVVQGGFPERLDIYGPLPQAPGCA